jgi:uncharacterized protein YecE (DUF72 family)
MDVWIGTAGYSYPAWVGGFYPPGTPAADLLPFYATHFPAVEINSSFYRPPTAAQAAKMAAKVPAGFRFSLKVPRTASHGNDLGELPTFRLAVEQVRAADKLLGLVVQFAEGFHNTPASRDWLSRVREELRPYPLAVEFRHRSWDVPGLPAWLTARDLVCVSVGVPAIRTLFPAGLRAAGERVYARLHTADAANWYAGGPARYDYDYPPEAIHDWADGLTAAAAQGVREAWFFFNNCVGIQAITNARLLAAELRGRPGVRVIDPPRPPQRSLFDEVSG